MKLTIEQLSKRTKLSVPTLRVYVSRQKLGTKVGNRRFFSLPDVQKLLKNSKGSKVKGKQREKTVKAAKKPTHTRASKQSTFKPKAPLATVREPIAKTEKRSFWSFLLGTRTPKQKVNLLQAKTTK